MLFPKQPVRTENTLRFKSPILRMPTPVNYHEITEFFIAWLRKSPPPPFDQWTWDSHRELAIRGKDEQFRRDMVAAYAAMTRHMPDNGMQVVMFTHQDAGVWADLGSILWAAGLRVTAAWNIVTETESALKEGNYVQGTVCLVLRKRIEHANARRMEIEAEIEETVAAQLSRLNALDELVARAHQRRNTLYRWRSHSRRLCRCSPGCHRLFQHRPPAARPRSLSQAR